MQGGRHAVEACSHLAKLVLGVDIDTHRKITCFHPLQPVSHQSERVDDIPVPGVQHDDRAANGQCHHHELEQVEDGCQARQLGFNGRCELVDSQHELFGIGLNGVLQHGCARAPAAALL